VRLLRRSARLLERAPRESLLADRRHRSPLPSVDAHFTTRAARTTVAPRRPRAAIRALARRARDDRCPHARVHAVTARDGVTPSITLA